MRRSRFTEERIIAVPREPKITDLCRKHGINDATSYEWKAEYGGLDVFEAVRLRVLEDETRRSKKPSVGSVLHSRRGRPRVLAGRRPSTARGRTAPRAATPLRWRPPPHRPTRPPCVGGGPSPSARPGTSAPGARRLRGPRRWCAAPSPSWVSSRTWASAVPECDASATGCIVPRPENRSENGASAT